MMIKYCKELPNVEQKSLNWIGLSFTVLAKWCPREHPPYEKDHCTAGLQFNWIGNEQTWKYIVICKYCHCLIQTSQTEGQTNHAVIIPLRWVFIGCPIENEILIGAINGSFQKNAF